jgi:hypothetical protein
VLSHALVALSVISALGCGLQEFPRGGAASPPPPPPPPAADAAIVPGPPQPNVPPPPGMSAMDAAVGADAGVPPDPPAGGPGITVAGRFVPKAKALVVLHIGHSNMAGRATTPPELKPFFYDTDPQLWVYGKGAFRPALEPTAPDNQDGQAAGPGMALLRTALAAAPPDTMVISIGHGHSGSFAGYCSSFRKGALFYDIVMTPARELKGKVTFAGIFTMFGQSEHNADAAQQARFSDCLKGMAMEMRTDLAEPDLPFMVGDYELGISRTDIAPTSPFAKRIIAELQLVPGKVPRSVLIPTDGLPMQDDHHFNMAGHRMWAERAIRLMIDRGWAPWAAAR